MLTKLSHPLHFFSGRPARRRARARAGARFPRFPGGTRFAAFRPCSALVLLVNTMWCLPSCLVPLPLEQENAADGGRLLIVSGADPPFGALLSLMNPTKPFPSVVHVQSDSANLAGRICVQLDDSCCTLKPEDPTKTRCFSDSQVTPTGGAPGSGSYDVKFPTFAPCQQLPSMGRIAYIVPVLATGGFDDSMGFGVNGLGTVDQTHYWSVLCR